MVKVNKEANSSIESKIRLDISNTLAYEIC